MSIDGQGTLWRWNIAENFNGLSRAHERYRHADRQTDDRRTDDDIANNAYQARPPGIPVREFPGIAEPKIPGGNSREFLKFWRELRGIYMSFVFFPIFIVDYDILLFNLTHCIMCTAHDGLLPLFEQNLEWRLYPTFYVYRVPNFRYTFKHWYRKSLNSVRISQTQIVTRMSWTLR